MTLIFSCAKSTATLRVCRSCFGSPDMMGIPELVTEMEREELGPLISTEGLEQLQNKYVQSVRVSVQDDKCMLLKTGSIIIIKYLEEPSILE